MHHFDKDHVIGTNSLHASAAGRVEHQKLNHCCGLVEFLVINSIHQLVSIPCDEVYRVADGGPDLTVHLHICQETKSCSTKNGDNFFKTNGGLICVFCSIS